MLGRSGSQTKIVKAYWNMEDIFEGFVFSYKILNPNARQ
jgi:hypothetical protein